MGWLCFVLPHKWVHIVDFIGGKSEPKVDIHLGLYQCSRCKQLSIGKCGNGPVVLNDNNN